MNGLDLAQERGTGAPGGVGSRIMDALAVAHDGAVQMIDMSIVLEDVSP
jgi:hypothetical protein